MVNKYILFAGVIAFFVGLYAADGFKSQNVRLFDVFILGPSMIYLGYKYLELLDNSLAMIDFTNIDVILSIILILSGAGTISYNLKNYLIIGHEGL